MSGKEEDEVDRLSVKRSSATGCASHDGDPDCQSGDLGRQRDKIDNMDTASVFEKRKEILKIAAKHGARNIRIFGSVARGEARADSDVDFLVDMEPGRTLFDMGGC